jgi:two-component system, cell cycle sensor histidine kinase and response regulator CckA
VNETILFVDDDATIRRVMGRGLRLKGYTVLEAENAEKALALFEVEGTGIRLLIADVMMPGMDGPMLACQLTETSPGLCVILVSGYSHPLTVQGLPSARTRVLTKPFGLDVLVAAAAELLEVG